MSQEKKRMKTEVELEGGGSFYYTVCGECHGAVHNGEKRCPHCGSELNWSGTELPGKRIYRGEQTEPAE